MSGDSVRRIGFFEQKSKKDLRLGFAPHLAISSRRVKEGLKVVMIVNFLPQKDFDAL